MKTASSLLAVLIVALAVQVWAGSMIPPGQVNKDAKMALHLIQHSGSCKGVTLNSRADIVSSLDTWSHDPALGGIDAFLVVFDYDSITGLDFGLVWPSEWGTASTWICIANPIAVGSIVNPGDGMGISWAGAECKIPIGELGGNSPWFLLATRSWLLPGGEGEIRIEWNPSTYQCGVVNCRDSDFRSLESVDSTYDAAVTLPTCEVVPVSLDFGTVPVGTSADRTFTITNTGTATMAGTVTESCDAYSIVGNPTYSLAPGYHKSFTVRYSPQTAGPHTCEIDPGRDCRSVFCTGSDVAARPATWGAVKAIFK